MLLFSDAREVMTKNSSTRSSFSDYQDDLTWWIHLNVAFLVRCQPGLGKSLDRDAFFLGPSSNPTIYDHLDWLADQGVAPFADDGLEPDELDLPANEPAASVALSSLSDLEADDLRAAVLPLCRHSSVHAWLTHVLPESSLAASSFLNRTCGVFVSRTFSEEVEACQADLDSALLTPSDSDQLPPVGHIIDRLAKHLESLERISDAVAASIIRPEAETRTSNNERTEQTAVLGLSDYLDEDLLTLQQAASILRVTPNTVKARIEASRNALPASNVNSGGRNKQYRVQVADLKAYLDPNRTGRISGATSSSRRRPRTAPKPSAITGPLTMD